MSSQDEVEASKQKIIDYITTHPGMTYSQVMVSCDLSSNILHNSLIAISNSGVWLYEDDGKLYIDPEYSFYEC